MNALRSLNNDLKQYKTETIKAYGEMAIEMVMVKGLTEDAIGRLAVLQRDVSEVKDDVRMLKAQLSELDGRLNQRLDGVIASLAVILGFADGRNKKSE